MSEDTKACSAKVSELFGFTSREDLAKLEDAMRVLKDQGASPKEIKDFAVGEAKKLRQADLVVISDSIKRKQTANKVMNNVERTVSTVKQAKKKLTKMYTNFINEFEGKNSIESLGNIESNQLKNGQYGQLKRAGVSKEYFSGEYDALVYEHMHRKGKKGSMSIVEDVPKGFTKEQAEIAMKIGEITNKTNMLMQANQKAVGIFTGTRKDYIAKRAYSNDKLTAMPPEDFVAYGKEHFKLDDMFPDRILNDQTALDKGLADLQQDLMGYTGGYKAGDDVKGSMNLLKSRSIEFKSGISEHTFMQMVSDRMSLAENIEVSLSKAGRTYGITKSLGMKSAQNFDELLQGMRKEFSDSIKGGKFNETEVAALKAKQVQLEGTVTDAYKIGVSNPHTPQGRITKIAQVIKSFNSMTKLGSSLFTSMYDGMTISLQYALATDGNQFKAFGEAAFEGLKQTFGPGNRHEIAEMLNVMTYINDPALAMGGNQGDYGTGFKRFNTVVGGVHKLTGVPFQTEISRNIGAMLQARSVKRMVGDIKSGKATEFQKLKMAKYGIDDADIDMLAKVKTPKNHPDIIAPSMVLELPLEGFHADPETAYKLRRDLFDKVGGWIDDATKAGTPEPGAKAKRVLLKGENIENEKARAVASLVMQFKETAYKILDENMQAYADYGRAAGGGGQAKGLGLYAVNGMISYLAIEHTKAAILGTKSPQEVYRKDGGRALFENYINKASFLPVLSDVGFASTDKYWRSAVPNMLLGPSFAAGIDFGSALHNPSRKTVGRAAKHVIPGSTWAPLKSYMNYGLEADIYTGQKIRK